MSALDLPERHWLNNALAVLEADHNRTGDTHLLRFPLPPQWGVDLYLKDESVYPTGSLKHRLARSLMLYGLINGWIREGTTIVEASSGSTAVSEAYFARLLDLPFVAVVPRRTSPAKLALIESYGGRCHLVDDAAAVYAEAARLADELGGHYLDQFTHAAAANDAADTPGLAQSIMDQMRLERHPVPRWIVVGVGTGGTSATLGRYVRRHRLPTGIVAVDPEGSAYYQAWRTGDQTVTTAGSRIEGIGRPRVEPSFVPGVVDRMLPVPDAASVAAMLQLRGATGSVAGPSTGTNLWGAFQLVSELVRAGMTGSVVTLICDRGDRYADTFHDDAWRAAQGLDPEPHLAAIEDFLSGTPVLEHV